MVDSTVILNSSPIQEIIQRYAIGTLHTVERTLESAHGLEISKTLFLLRNIIQELAEQLHREALPIRTLDAISVELLKAIQICVNASILSKGNIETRQ